MHDPDILTPLRAGSSVVVIGRPATGKTMLLESAYAELAAKIDPSDLLVLAPNRPHANMLRDRLRLPAGALLTRSPARSISSFAFGIARAIHSVRTGEDLAFVSGADQDVLISDLLAGHESGRGSRPDWPEVISAEVRATSAFRSEVRDALNLVMAHDFGIRVPRAVTDPDTGEAVRIFDSGRSALSAALERFPDPRWQALSAVLGEYLDLMAMPGFGGTDSAAVLARAAFAVLAEPIEVTAGSKWSFSESTVPRIILADAVQDFPAAAWGIFDQLRSRGTKLILFGSPETVTGRFHGADASILDRAVNAGDFVTVVLDERHTTSARLGEFSDDFARRVSTRFGLGHLPRPTPLGDSDAEAGRSALTDGSGASAAEGVADSRVRDEVGLEAHVFGSTASEHRFLARRIAEYVDAGHSWSDVAVLARTTSTARVLAEELRAAGVRATRIVTALSLDPATAPLLGLLLHSPDFDDDESLTEAALGLAGTVYVRLDTVALRRFRRLVRRRYPAVDSTASIAQALRDPEPDRRIPGLAVMSGMLRAASDHASDDPHTALWAIWDAAGSAVEWQRAALADPESAAGGHLDAVLRLFALAEKFADRGGFTASSFAATVAEQDIAQDSLAETSADADLVCVGTPASVAHRRFPVVVIAEVDEGVWPNPKLRGGMLGLDDLASVLGGGALVTTEPGWEDHARRKNLREEGELLYTALTRAQDRVIITSVLDAETTPSPFFDILALRADTSISDGDGYRISHEDELPPLDTEELSALVRAKLLAAAGQEESVEGNGAGAATDVGPTEEIQDWARLARALADAGADPQAPAWRETEDLSSDAPLHGPDEVVRISPSQVESFSDCALRWFLTRHGGDRPMSTAQSLGTILHAAAERFPEGPLSSLRDFVEGEFTHLSFDTQWQRDRDHELALFMVDRLGDYIRSAPGAVIGVEVQVEADGVDASGRPWQINGRLDRIERTTGGVRIVDFKTGQVVAATADMPRHAQLGVYQEAIENGTITLPDGTTLDEHARGGELVYLRKSAKTTREQAALFDVSEPGWARVLIDEVSGAMRASSFPAHIDPEVCRSCPVRSSCPAIGPRLMEESS